MDTVINIIFGIITPAIVSIIGWFVIDYHNRKMRKEEAGRKIYDELFHRTNDMIKNLIDFRYLIERDSEEISEMLIRLSNEKNKKRKNVITESWRSRVEEMVNRIKPTTEQILDYMRILDFGGTDFGRESAIYKGLHSVSIDVNEAIIEISGKWIGYSNLNGTSELQIRKVIEETNKELKKVDEFTACLEDVLVCLYNKYVAKPLKLPVRKFEFVQNRRYITESGIYDNRL